MTLHTSYLPFLSISISDSHKNQKKQIKKLVTFPLVIFLHYFYFLLSVPFVLLKVGALHQDLRPSTNKTALLCILPPSSLRRHIGNKHFIYGSLEGFLVHVPFADFNRHKPSSTDSLWTKASGDHE